MMKRILKTLALILALVLALSVVVVATEGDVDADGKKATLKFLEGFNGTAVFEETTGDYVNVTVQSSSFDADDGYYLVLALKDKDTIDEESILYIDQIPAADGVVSFEVYPSTMTTSTIVITGVKADGTSNGKVYVAIIKGKYILGDVTGDGKINDDDLLRLAKYLAGKTSDIVSDAADVTQKDGIEDGDLLRLAKYLAGKATLG